MLNVKGSTKVAALAASAGIVIALVGLCVPTAASAKAPSTKPLSSVEVNSPDITIATSTHHTLKLKLSVSDFVSHANPDTSAGSIDIQLGTPNGREAHGWVFQLTAGSITDHVGTSTGVVTTGAHQISPFGRIRLTFSPDGPSSTLTCGKTTVVTRHVKVAAAMSFDTALQLRTPVSTSSAGQFAGFDPWQIGAPLQPISHASGRPKATKRERRPAGVAASEAPPGRGRRTIREDGMDRGACGIPRMAARFEPARPRDVDCARRLPGRSGARLSREDAAQCPGPSPARARRDRDRTVLEGGLWRDGAIAGYSSRCKNLV